MTVILLEFSDDMFFISELCDMPRHIWGRINHKPVGYTSTTPSTKASSKKTEQLKKEQRPKFQ